MTYRCITFIIVASFIGCSPERSLSTSDAGSDRSDQQRDPNNTSAACPYHSPSTGMACSLDNDKTCNYSLPLNPSCFDGPVAHCTCSNGRWECRIEGACDSKTKPDASNPCPRTVPELDSSCRAPADVTCDYFLEKSRCGYLDLYQHCECAAGLWWCRQDREDCLAADAGLSTD
jgi:hypothetical protein